MIRLFLIFLIFFGCHSSRPNSNHVDCGEELRLLNCPLLQDGLTKVYTINYDKIEYPMEGEQIRDSVYWSQYINLDSNAVKHLYFSQLFKQLIKNNKKYSITNIRNCLGRESQSSLGQTLKLYYFFNHALKPNCYNPDLEFGPYSQCSLLVLEFDEQGILNKVLTDFFSW